jgi:hypothetical protein
MGLMKASLALLLLLPLAAADQNVTAFDARKLAFAAMPQDAKKRGVTSDLDRQESGCVVYHVHRYVGEFPFIRTATIGSWSIDLPQPRFGTNSIQRAYPTRVLTLFSRRFENGFV